MPMKNPKRFTPKSADPAHTYDRTKPRMPKGAAMAVTGSARFRMARGSVLRRASSIRAYRHLARTGNSTSPGWFCSASTGSVTTSSWQRGEPRGLASLETYEVPQAASTSASRRA